MVTDYGIRKATQKKTKAEKRQILSNTLSNPNALASVMAQVADGRAMKEIAQGMGVEYPILFGLLRSEYKDEYQAAKAAHAEDLAMRNLKLADDVEDGRIDPNQAKTASGIRQWYMERADAATWGQKSTVDMNVKGVVGLHMEAIRELSRREATHEEIEADEADYTEVKDEDTAGPDYDLDNDPLL